MNRYLATWALIAWVALCATHLTEAQTFHPLSRGTPTTVENFVGEMFYLTKSSGSMTLGGTCEGTSADNVVASDALTFPPKGPFNNLGEALTAVSQIDSHIAWANDANGLTRVQDARVSNGVLGLRLRRVHFGGEVDASSAIQVVMSAPEVREHFKENNIEDGAPTIGLMSGSTKGMPKLTGDLLDVTVAEALDHIVRFFPGLWIYKECRSGSSKRVTVRGFSVPSAKNAAGGPAIR